MNIKQQEKLEKTPRMHFKGLDSIDKNKETKEQLQQIVLDKIPKLQHHFNNIYDVEMHFKEHQSKGQRSRYEIHTKLSYPGAIISSTEQGWDFIKVVHKSLDQVEQQLRSKYREDQRQQSASY